jgi:hypothetical protein
MFESTRPRECDDKPSSQARRLNETIRWVLVPLSLPISCFPTVTRRQCQLGQSDLASLVDTACADASDVRETSNNRLVVYAVMTVHH